MTEASNRIIYDENTEDIDMWCALIGDSQIPGWSINLKGWTLSDSTLAAVWSKLRKVLRFYNVDAVALFRMIDSEQKTCEMTIVPETSILGNKDMAFAAYANQLARVLSKEVLKHFVAFLTKAQTLAKNGKSTEEIVLALFPSGFELKLVRLSDVDKHGRRKVRKVAKQLLKTAAKESKQAVALAQKLQAQAEESQREAQAADDENLEALTRTAEQDVSFAQIMAERAAEAKRNEQQIREQYEYICQFFRSHRLADDPSAKSANIEFTNSLISS